MLNTEDVEHELFMMELCALRDKLFTVWITQQHTREELSEAKSDIDTYGTEPMFASTIFDALIEEANQTR